MKVSEVEKKISFMKQSYQCVVKVGLMFGKKN